VDPKRIAVAGDSAGGNLAALVSRAARDVRATSQDHPAIVFQALIYPVIDAGCNTASYADFGTDHGLTKEQMQYFWRCYCGGDASDEVAASPLQGENLSGLPATWILTAELDVLRDEAESYAFKLKTAGTKVDFERWRGQIHGFIHNAGFFDEGRRAVERVGQKLKAALK
jgi:acetyl esterase